MRGRLGTAVTDVALSVVIVVATATVVHRLHAVGYTPRTALPPGHVEVSLGRLLYMYATGQTVVAPSPEPVLEPGVPVSAPRRLQVVDQAAPAVDPKLNTTWGCTRIAPFLDVCVYENICTDGEYWYFIDPDALKKNRTRDPVVYPVNDFKTGVVYPMSPAGLSLPSPNAPFPFNAGGLRGKRRTPEFLAALGANVTWTDEVPWVPSFEFPLDNTYYWTTRIAPLFTARQFNSTPTFTYKLPRMDMLYVTAPRQPFASEWHKQLLTVALGNEEPRVEYKDGAWATSHLSLNDNKWVCFNKAVITGTFSMAVPDPMTAFQFRDAVYDKFAVERPSPSEPPPPKVLFWLRPKSGRSFANVKDVLAIADKYNLKYTVMTQVPSFEEQVRLFASHGVVVSPHGAGLMNLLFSPPFGAVVEVFPYRTHHNLYSGLAAMMGLAHYPVHTHNGTTTLAYEKTYFSERCSAYSPLEINYKSAFCKATIFHKPIFVDLWAFETALVNAMVHVGVNLHLRGVAPQKDPTTVTGWK